MYIYIYMYIITLINFFLKFGRMQIRQVVKEKMEGGLSEQENNAIYTGCIKKNATT